MANEITSNITFSASKGGASVSMTNQKRTNMSGSQMIQATQAIGTTSEAISLGDVSGAPAEIALKNLDSTNFLEVGGDSGLTVFKIKILPGKACLFQPTSGTLYAKADTAPVLIQVVAMEA